MSTDGLHRSTSDAILAALERDVTRADAPLVAAARQRLLPLAAVGAAAGLTISVLAATEPRILIWIGALAMLAACWAALFVDDHDGRSGVGHIRRAQIAAVRRVRSHRLVRRLGSRAHSIRRFGS